MAAGRKIPGGVRFGGIPLKIGYPVVILAAGRSSRMGQTKALMPLEGIPMICRVVETCLESEFVSTVIVVTGHERSGTEPVLAAYPVTLVHNADYLNGEMLSSVQAGVRALPEGCTAFFLMPGDQPLVEASTYEAVGRCMRDSGPPVVLPVYDGKRGHPVLISGLLIQEILSLAPGDTLKTALSRHRDRSVEIAVSDSGVVFDVDTPEDYVEAHDRFER